jgi:hypothetical protein
VTRPNTEWLTGVIRRLEGTTALRHRVTVVGNNTAFVRDGRLVIGPQQRPAGDHAVEPAEVSVRYTTAVATIMRLASDPIVVADLVNKLSTDFPETPHAVIDRIIGSLIAQGVLITQLRPPFTEPDPLSHVLAVLDEVKAENISDLVGLIGELRAAGADGGGSGG